MRLTLLLFVSYISVQASTEINNLPTDIASLQQRVSGTVTDSNGESVPGTTIQEKGTNNGAVTDIDGNFSLNVSGPESILLISSVGFITQEVTVGNQTSFNIQLDEDLTALEEVVVVAYGTARKKDLTGAVAVIGAEELNAFPATTVDEALQGKTAGVQVTSNSGAPGASVSVNIRGVGTFGNTTPLYIVDGFPTQDISFINPTTIQSLTVLKDASATALYGVRASNGVVIIQTKQGSKGMVEVELNSFIGFRTSPREIDVLGVEDFTSFATELSSSDNAQVRGNAVPYTGWSDPSQLRTINWQDEIFDQALRKSTTLNVRGGGEKSRVAFTAGVYDEEGTLLGSEYTRYDLGLNTSFDINDKLRLNANAKYISSQGFQPLGTGRDALLNLFSTIPHLAPAGEANNNPNDPNDVNPTNLPVDENGNFGAFPDVGGESFRDGRNWVARALENDQDNLSTTILANADIEWDIIGGLSTQVKVGARVDNNTGSFFQPEYYRSNGNLDVRPNASFSNDQSTSNEWLGEYILKYSETFAGRHKFGVLAGTSAQRITFRSSGGTGVGFLNNNVRSVAAADQITRAQGFQSTRTLASTFARVNYDYSSKYYVTATVRRDGVGDVFGVSNLYGTFPSVAVGWNVDEESFFQSTPFDFLKVRGSWGVTGNFSGIPSFGFTSFYVSDAGVLNSNYSFDGSNSTLGLVPRGSANPDLQWEEQTQFNVGIEGAVLDNSLYFTIDYFNKESEGLLFNATVPSQSGFTSQAQNGATAVNKGFEFLVGHRKNVGDFSWDINANLTTISNEITQINSQSGLAVFPNEFLDDFFTGGFWFDVTQSRLGGEVGTFYGFVADGIFQNQGEIDALNADAPSGNYQDSDTAPGDRRFRDLNGDGEITGDDRTTIGSPIPDFYGSVNLNFSYKGFDLGLNFYGTYGNEILNLVKRELESASGYGNNASFSNVSTEYFENRWNGEGSTNSFARALIDDNAVQNNRASSYFVEDGSYLRLRNVTLGYNLPSSLVGKVGLGSVRFYASLQNLFTITNYSGTDPEIGQNTDINGNNSVTTRGIDAGAYPLSKSYTFGLNLKF
ncbi:SusC/RagA family TonB-linked outer membrane protein [Ekhidna sp.]